MGPCLGKQDSSTRDPQGLASQSPLPRIRTPRARVSSPQQLSTPSPLQPRQGNPAPPVARTSLAELGIRILQTRGPVPEQRTAPRSQQQQQQQQQQQRTEPASPVSQTSLPQPAKTVLQARGTAPRQSAVSSSSQRRRQEQQQQALSPDSLAPYPYPPQTRVQVPEGRISLRSDESTAPSTQQHQQFQASASSPGTCTPSRRPHAPECRCRTCQPGLSDADRLTMFEEAKKEPSSYPQVQQSRYARTALQISLGMSQFGPGVRCPNLGHKLPEHRRCGSSLCQCYVGCADRKCQLCRI